MSRSSRSVTAARRGEVAGDDLLRPEPAEGGEELDVAGRVGAFLGGDEVAQLEGPEEGALRASPARS